MLKHWIPSPLRGSFGWIVARNLSLSAPLAQAKQQQATDPIQQLFVNKIREYYDKRKSVFFIFFNQIHKSNFYIFRQTTDGLVDATPDVRKSLEETLNKLKHAYGAESDDLLSVPKLSFKGKSLF